MILQINSFKPKSKLYVFYFVEPNLALKSHVLELNTSNDAYNEI